VARSPSLSEPPRETEITGERDTLGTEFSAWCVSLRKPQAYGQILSVVPAFDLAPESGPAARSRSSFSKSGQSRRETLQTATMARLLVNGFQIAADYCLRPRQADRPLATFLLTGDNRGRLQVAESRRTERFVFPVICGRSTA